MMKKRLGGFAAGRGRGGAAAAGGDCAEDHGRAAEGRERPNNHHVPGRRRCARAHLVKRVSPLRRPLPPCTSGCMQPALTVPGGSVARSVEDGAHNLSRPRATTGTSSHPPHVLGEFEFLFSAYSAFEVDVLLGKQFEGWNHPDVSCGQPVQVVFVHWSPAPQDKTTRGLHEITLRTLPDNRTRSSCCGTSLRVFQVGSGLHGTCCARALSVICAVEITGHVCNPRPAS